MLTTLEKILFALFALATLAVIYRDAARLLKIIHRGHGSIDWALIRKRLAGVVAKTTALTPTWRLRPVPTFFHALVAWGFMYYLLVNAGDVYEGYFEAKFLGTGTLGNIYRLLADLLSGGALIGMAALMVRRQVIKPANLTARESTLLHPKARAGIRRDSLIVGVFILLHVGFRLIGQSFTLRLEGPDAWQPLATAVSGLWAGFSEPAAVAGQHVGFWVALGLIMAFFPYLPYSKHLHLIFTPINFLVTPERKSMGQLSYVDFEDDSLESFGATRLEDLGFEQLVDAYACIMCYRCQEVCPAYQTGKVLSPATLEINKRYFLNQEGKQLAGGGVSSQTLIEFAIPTEAVWACTACGACVDICPVGNEPMRDILDIRRSLVLMENEFPPQLQNAYRGMERNANPWAVAQTERLKWAERLVVPTIEENPEAEILWWVGCAAATDVRAQKTARAFAEILNKAGVSFAILGQGEACTGDAARRTGAEHIFFELATMNVEALNEVTANGGPKRIVAACPHCLHTLMNEYPAFGGHYEVIHHSQLINELVGAGKLRVDARKMIEKVTFHDPCYLGRQNGIVDAPRIALDAVAADRVEMAAHGEKSFCCGAGGGQAWKEEEHGDDPVNATRFRQAAATGAGTLAVGCPFCMTMLTDAAKDAESEIQVKDVAEIVAESLA
jgi:Fe-S oxidoreductase